MKYILNATQMKASDSYTIHEIGIPSAVLMERAALQTVKVMKEIGIDLNRTLIVCGSGNNGGDGFAIARLLAEDGFIPDVVFVGNEKSRSEETCLQMQILENMGMEIGNCLPEKEYSAIIDALFGIGLSRKIVGRYQEIIEKMNAYTGCKIAVDIASGISADDGAVMGCAFRADHTVTFAYEKLGQILFPGKSYSGQVHVVPIGITERALGARDTLCFTYEQNDVKRLLPKRIPDSNKGSYGRVLCIAGSKGMSGAAYLSAKAAYLAGAGLVQIYTEESNREILQQLLPEAIITTYDETDRIAFYQLPELLEWASVVCMGCGMGTGATSRRLVEFMLMHCEKPMIIDADALNIISGYPEEKSRALFANRTHNILTPHMKEMSRLCKKSVVDLKENRIEYSNEFVERFPVTLVLKDSRTLVQKAENPVYVNTSGNAAMAKAGAGDVLAGIITGLMAQRMDSFEAASLGVFLHGLAGDEAKKRCGSYSVLAEDLLTGIRNVLIDLEE